ncbi:PREDICTED: BTB/POZ domain-containing protein 2-like [Dufourea novaeangliae]|uniref:BTB/POZ domain-containing protein 2-like n=1 Tax=Dufourea novaeangliae TaxID=178035 RepID=UPI000767184A|nr:PREDICTED: BTB/POZ domain-containing protein 2-like [Dufourea novaeangliae]
MEMGMPRDWQINKQKISERGQYLLETGKWSDCKFVVGQEPHQQILKGHKLFLAMSSPVFEAMFFGGMAEKNDPIPIQDVQPEAFKALLQYIYTDIVTLSSFELACELCYCAKKYMLPSLVELCTKYLWSDLSPKKACRAYEFAKLFEEPIFMEKCLQVIRTKTNEVLKETNWEDVELATLLTVLDQDYLLINSEIDLFNAVECWAKAECARKSLDPSDGKLLRSVIGDALLKIRFLRLSPQEFAEGPGISPLLTQTEAFAILMNIVCVGNKTPMPEGFSTDARNRAESLKASVGAIDCSKFKAPCTCTPYSSCSHTQHCWPSPSSHSFERFYNAATVMEGGMRGGSKYYGLRKVFHETDCLNSNVLDCSVTFTADKDICVLGVQVPTQLKDMSPDMSYTELLYAHLLDSDGTRLTFTHFTTKVNINTLVEITFNRPIYVLKHKVYRVGVVFNSVGCYPMGLCSESAECNSVVFSFGIGNSKESVRDGLIRSIVFTHK